MYSLRLGMFWYEDEIKRLESERSKITDQPDTLFYGSSTIRLWAGLGDDLKDFKPANLGFGGSTLAACDWFFDRVMKGYQPKRLVVYAGDNDLGDGRHPEEVFIFFQQLVVRAQKQFGDMPCYFISLKPSISRWNQADQFRFTNMLIKNEIGNDPNWRYIDLFDQLLDSSGHPKKEYYSDDGLHLSPAGYAVWAAIVKQQLSADS